MKLGILLMFLYVSVSVTAQIPKNANVITVKGVSYSEVLNKLLDSGYTIETKDADLQTARTEYRLYPKLWNAAYKISVRVKDSVAYFRSNFTSPFDDFLTKAANKSDPLFNMDPAENITNNKGESKEKHIITYPFLLLNKFVKSFDKPVEYLKQ